jgi:cbb3-type cytochrome oxidase subunit 1
MRGIARAFFTAALVYGLLGLLLGLDMGIRHDHVELPTHAHIMVVGWVSFAIFGVFYHLLGHAVPPLLANLHFWLAQASLVILVLGLWLIYAGHTEFDPLAAVGSIGYAASFAVFAIGAFLAMRAPLAP